MKWDLFLSHAGTDRDLALSLQTALEALTIGDRPVRVWLDDTDIPAGASIPKHVEEGLQESRRFGILMTRSYFASHSGWTDAEWHAALYQDPDNRARKLLPLLAGECDVPFLLAHLRHIDVRDTARLQRGVAQIVTALQSDGERNAAPRAALRIESALPDTVDETLPSNVFSLEIFPDQLFTADIAPNLLSRRSSHLSKATFETRLNGARPRGVLPPYHLDNQRLVTYGDPSRTDSPFRSAIVPNSVHRISTRSPTLTSAARRGVVALLNATMADHLGRNEALKRVPDDDRVYYGPQSDGAFRSVTWPAGQRMATRRVAKPMADPKTGESGFGSIIPRVSDSCSSARRTSCRFVRHIC